MSYILRTSTEHKTASLADEGNLHIFEMVNQDLNYIPYFKQFVMVRIIYAVLGIMGKL